MGILAVNLFAMDTLPAELVIDICHRLPLKQALALRDRFPWIPLADCFVASPMVKVEIMINGLRDPDLDVPLYISVMTQICTKQDIVKFEILQYSARYGHVGVLKCLKQDFDLRKEDAQTGDNFALRLAAMNGHVQVLKCLKEDFGLGKEDAQADNNAALRLAAANGHVNVLKCLKEEPWLGKEDAQALNNYALRWAAGKGHLEVLKYLKEGFGLGKADAQAASEDGNCALTWAANNGHVKVVKCLKEEYRLSKEDVKYNAFSVVIQTAQRGHVEVLECLKEEYGVSKEDICKWGSYVNYIVNIDLGERVSIIGRLNRVFY